VWDYSRWHDVAETGTNKYAGKVQLVKVGSYSVLISSSAYAIWMMQHKVSMISTRVTADAC
jgi:hypothetical protein